jgi:hypothetical protein
MEDWKTFPLRVESGLCGSFSDYSLVDHVINDPRRPSLRMPRPPCHICSLTYGVSEISYTVICQPYYEAHKVETRALS